MAKRTAKDVEKQLAERGERTPPIPPEDFLSFGLTPLNLAVSGHSERGIAKGMYLFFVGESSSGKTWISIQLLGEAVRKSSFDKHRIIGDFPENGALMDVQRYFGRRLQDRLEAPKYDKAGNARYSCTVQELYYHLDAALDRGPCIYLLDSMDALSDINAEEKFEAERELYETGKGEVPGSMGMEKAKTNSQHINRVVRRLAENGSIFVNISQTRNKTGSRFPMRTRSGGDALRFYSHVEVWTKKKEVIESRVLGKEREAGAILQFDVQKNRISGWEGIVTAPFYRGVGIDDLGACVDYLVEERVWEVRKKEKGARGGDVIVAADFDVEGDKETVIQHVEAENAEAELRKLVAARWREVEEALTPKRKPRYADD